MATHASHGELLNESSEAFRKLKSRQGGTLSRWASVIYWNGDALCIGKYVPTLPTVIVSSVDEESDQDRVKHVGVPLSSATQDSMDQQVVSEIVDACEDISRSARY
jgi:hypothetical protein